MDESYDVSRRDVLKGGAAAALGATGLAGCLGEELPEYVELPEVLDDPDQYAGDLIATKGFAEFQEETVRSYIVMVGKVPVTQYDHDWWYDLHTEADAEAPSIAVHDEHGKLPGHGDMDAGEFYDDKVEFTGRLKEHDGDADYFLELHEVNELQQ